MSGITDSYANDKRVLTATFPTQGGATLAARHLQEMEKEGLLDVENTVTINKSAADKIDFHEYTGGDARKGAGIGALVGGVVGLIFPPSILATTALGAAVGGMTGAMRGDKFDSAEIKALAEDLQPGQSMLVTVVDPKWTTEVEAALAEMPAKYGWAVLPKAVVEELLRLGR